MRRCAWIVLLSLFVLRAQAQGSLPLELEWQVPRECPSATDVRLELERIARARPGYALSPLWARAVVTTRGRSYQVALQTEQAGQRGERQLEAPDCTTLLRTVTLVLALTFGAGVELTEHATSPGAGAATTVRTTAMPQAQTVQPAQQTDPAQHEQQTSQTPAKVQTASAEQTASAAALVAQPSDLTVEPSERAVSSQGPEQTALTWSLLAGVGTQLGLLPTAALLLSAGAELDGHAWSLGLRARGSFARQQQLPEDVDAHFDALGAALTACWRLPLTLFTASLCGAAQAATLRGSTSGATTGSAHAPWYALSGTAGLTWPQASRLRVRAEAGLAASLNRPRFEVQGLGQVHQVPPIQPEFTLLLLFSP